jgi:hypothetical protein
MNQINPMTDFTAGATDGIKFMSTPNPGEGFILCEANDPERTHFWLQNPPHRWELKGIAYPWPPDGHVWRKPIVVKEGWISVKDRLPEPGLLVWMLPRDGCMFANKAMLEITDSSWTNGWITHWQPAHPPEPPKVEREGEKAWDNWSCGSVTCDWKPVDVKAAYLAGYEAGRKGT